MTKTLAEHIDQLEIAHTRFKAASAVDGYLPLFDMSMQIIRELLRQRGVLLDFVIATKLAAMFYKDSELLDLANDAQKITSLDKPLKKED